MYPAACRQPKIRLKDNIADEHFFRRSQDEALYSPIVCLLPLRYLLLFAAIVAVTSRSLRSYYCYYYYLLVVAAIS